MIFDTTSAFTICQKWSDKWICFLNWELQWYFILFKVDGTASFSIPLDAIKTMNSYLTGQTLTVEANVTESLNHITLSGNNEVKFYARAEKMEFLKSNPNTFKPGLSYTAYVSSIYTSELFQEVLIVRSSVIIVLGILMQWW